MTRNIKLGPSAHVDTFTRDNLPPFDQWPDLLLDRMMLDVNAFVGSTPQHDDITCMLIKVA